MIMDLDFKEEDGRWRIQWLQIEIGGMMFTQVQAPEGNTLDPACLMLYCLYNLEVLQ
jgi:hypothetical protein